MLQDLDSIKEAENWRSQSACMQHMKEKARLSNGQNIFSPWESHKLEDKNFAINICKRECPVQQECLLWAVENGEDSLIYGGLDEAERETLKRRHHGRKNLIEYLKAEKQMKRAS